MYDIDVLVYNNDILVYNNDVLVNNNDILVYNNNNDILVFGILSYWRKHGATTL